MADTGRPTVMTAETIQKLEDGFLKGFNDHEACLYAGIAPSTLYNYQKENPDFLEKKEMLKENVKMHAKTNVHEAIVVKKNLSLSQWYVEHTDKDFKKRTDTTTDDKPIVGEPVNEAALVAAGKAYAEVLKKQKT